MLLLFWGVFLNSLDDYVKKITNQIGADAIVFLDCRFIRRPPDFYFQERVIDTKKTK